MKENPIVPRKEQETVIQISRDTDVANIYTTDSRYINKLNKIYKPSKKIKCDRQIVAMEYDVPAKAISFRSKLSKKAMSDEEKQKLASRLKNESKG